MKQAENTSNLSTAESDIDRQTRHDRHRQVESSDDENIVVKRTKTSVHKNATSLASSVGLPEVPLTLRNSLYDITNSLHNTGEKNVQYRLNFQQYSRHLSNTRKPISRVTVTH